MKKIIIGFFLLLLSTVGHTQPYLNSFPIPNNNIKYFEITIDNNIYYIQPELDSNGDAYLKFDMNKIDLGNKDITVRIIDNNEIPSDSIFLHIYSYNNYISLSPVVRCLYIFKRNYCF